MFKSKLVVLYYLTKYISNKTLKFQTSSGRGYDLTVQKRLLDLPTHLNICVEINVTSFEC